MNTKKYLDQLKNIDRRISDKIEEAEMWKNIALGTHSTVNEDRVQTSPKYDKMGDAISLAVDFEMESNRLAKELSELKRKITFQIDSMENELFYNILKAYYIKNKSLMEIAVSENYSYKQLKRHYESALKEFEKMFENQYFFIDMSVYVQKCPQMSTSQPKLDILQ